MNICVCVDDSMGMSFFGKRQSRDRLLIERLLSHTEYDRILVSAYSAPLFAEFGDSRVCTVDGYGGCTERDLCFLELDTVPDAGDTERIVLYRWNRRYPSDKKFPYSPSECGFTLASRVDLAGNSHDNITEEVWTK